MRLREGDQLLRLAVRTPCNLGSAAGVAALDRPTQKEAWHGLPFVPDSALKGVLAGRFGNVGEETENQRREWLFGSPDRAGRPGRPAPLVVGNGELLCFPLPLGDGSVVWVFPALAVARVLRLEPAIGPDPKLVGLLHALELPAEGPPPAIGWPRVPALPRAPVRPLAGASAVELAPALEGYLRRYVGEAVPAGAYLLVVRSAHAALLWRHAAEVRTLTAIDGETDTVAAGSLRTVELIPVGTVFLSLASCLQPPRDVDLPERIQVGAWESLGLGWIELSLVDLAAPARPATPPPAAAGREAVDEADVMVAMHRAVQGLRGAGPKLESAVRAAVGHFGPRAQFSGIEAALAFELAKARPGRREVKVEAKAHRWLLAALLTREPKPEVDPKVLLDWLGERPFDPAKIAAERDLILARWRWLRRYAEFGLAAEEAVP